METFNDSSKKYLISMSIFKIIMQALYALCLGLYTLFCMLFDRWISLFNGHDTIWDFQNRPLVSSAQTQETEGRREIKKNPLKSAMFQRTAAATCLLCVLLSPSIFCLVFMTCTTAKRGYFEGKTGSKHRVLPRFILHSVLQRCRAASSLSPCVMVQRR